MSARRPARRGHALACLAVAWAAMGSAAVPAQTVSLPPSQALACLTPKATERGVPEYPALRAETKVDAVVPVELVFTAPDAAPHWRWWATASCCRCPAPPSTFDFRVST